MKGLTLSKVQKVVSHPCPDVLVITSQHVQWSGLLQAMVQEHLGPQVWEPTPWVPSCLIATGGETVLFLFCGPKPIREHGLPSACSYNRGFWEPEWVRECSQWRRWCLMRGGAWCRAINQVNYSLKQELRRVSVMNRGLIRSAFFNSIWFPLEMRHKEVRKQ